MHVVTFTLTHLAAHSQCAMDSLHQISVPALVAKLVDSQGIASCPSLNTHTCNSSGRYRRFFSSQQMSFVASESDLQLITSLHTGTPHSYCQEASPFQIEFSEALKGKEGVELGGTTDEEGLSDQSEISEVLPPHLLEDPSFRDNVSKFSWIPKKV